MEGWMLIEPIIERNISDQLAALSGAGIMEYQHTGYVKQDKTSWLNGSPRDAEILLEHVTGTRHFILIYETTQL